MLVFHPRLEERQNVENPKWEWGKQELGEGEFIWPIEGKWINEFEGLESFLKNL